MEGGTTHYDLLEVREDASLEVIKGAYKDVIAVPGSLFLP